MWRNESFWDIEKEDRTADTKVNDHRSKANHSDNLSRIGSMAGVGWTYRKDPAADKKQ
jgi:hypothetical protein